MLNNNHSLTLLIQQSLTDTTVASLWHIILTPSYVKQQSLIDFTDTTVAYWYNSRFTLTHYPYSELC